LAALIESLPNNDEFALGFEYLPDVLGTLSEFLLKFADELVILSFGVIQVVVGQLGILLFKLTFDFVSRAFEPELVHTSGSLLSRWLAAPEAIDWRLGPSGFVGVFKALVPELIGRPIRSQQLPAGCE
jgi:hypothetical protein